MGNCFVPISNEIKCFGTNYLGDGTNSHSSTLVDVMGISNAKLIFSGYQSHFAILNDNTVKFWGKLMNTNYVCSLNGAEKTSPELCADFYSAIDISSSSDHPCAVLGSGKVKCTGAHDNGKRGANCTAGSCQTVNGIDNAIMVTTGQDFSCTLLSDGLVKCWGGNRWGQLGNGNTSDSTIPVTVLGINNAKKIESGGVSTCALLSDGRVKCWGNQFRGYLGNGLSVEEAISTPVFVNQFGK